MDYAERKSIIKNLKGLNIPVGQRNSFIRFCRGHWKNYYGRHCFWNQEKEQWGEYAPVEERSRCYYSMADMWEMYNL